MAKERCHIRALSGCAVYWLNTWPYYNQSHPHQGIRQHTRISMPVCSREGPIGRRGSWAGSSTIQVARPLGDSADRFFPIQYRVVISDPSFDPICDPLPDGINE
jgi:hypothetical protein